MLALGACAACAVVHPTSAFAEEPPPGGQDAASRRHFYKGYDYGSQSLYNPLYLFVNRGFDVLQLRPNRRRIWDYDYVANGENVLDNVKDPFGAIGYQGWGKFVKEEILPVGWTTQSARWAPNCLPTFSKRTLMACLTRGARLYTPRHRKMMRHWRRAAFLSTVLALAAGAAAD